MSSRRKLTWQGRNDGAGRWKKIYRGQVHYFAGGTGKSDLAAYRQALAEWERLKVALDQEAEEQKPHRAQYEMAIGQWQAVLASARENSDLAVLTAASVKIGELRKRLSHRNPAPIDRRRDVPLIEIGMSVGTSVVPLPEADRVTPGAAHKLAQDLDVPDNLEPEHIHKVVNKFFTDQTWATRIRREQAKSAESEQQFWISTQVQAYVKKRTVAGVTAGGIANLQRHLNFFLDQLGSEFDARKISGGRLDHFHQDVLLSIENKRFSRASARDLEASVRSFVRWLWEVEVLTELPRNLNAKSHRIVIEPNVVKVFSTADIYQAYTASNENQRLFMLLALNCGMTQIDIAEIHPTDVDWGARTLSRKRGKTSQFESVPTVTYSLWPETLSLLQKFRSDDSELLLLAPEGGPLKFEVSREGKIAKNDYVGQSFRKLLKAQKLKGQFKMLKKTSASLLRDHPAYSGLESLFLDHAPRSMSDKHYAQVPTKLLSQALGWLHDQFQWKGKPGKKRT